MTRIGRSPPKSGRRFRLLDLVFLVALAAVPLAAIATVLRAPMSPDARMAFTGIALSAPLLVGLLWLLTEPGVLRSRWGEGMASVLYVGLTLAAIIVVLVLYAIHPIAALMIGAEMLGFLAYLLTWL